MAISREIDDIARSLVHHHHDHPPVRNANQEADRQLNLAQRTAEELGLVAGSWTFVILELVLVAAWIALNLLPQAHHWDPYPFRLLSMILSLEAALLVCLVLMGQARARQRARIEAQATFEAQVKEEEETRSLMDHLENQDEILLQLLARLDRANRDLRRLEREAHETTAETAGGVSPG